MTISKDILNDILVEFKCKAMYVLKQEGFLQDCYGHPVEAVEPMLQCLVILLRQEYNKKLAKRIDEEFAHKLAKEDVGVGYTDNGMDISYGDNKIEVPWDDIKQQILFREGVPV